MGCVRFRRGKWVLDYRDQYGKRKWETSKFTQEEDYEKVVKLLVKREREIEQGEFQSKKEHKKF